MNRFSTILLVILLTVAVVLTQGCGIFRESAIGISASEVKNNNATRKVAINYLQIWPMQSGFLHGLMQHREDEFPEHIVDAINELDDLAAKLATEDPNSMFDYDLGLSLGLRVRMLGAVVEEVFKAYSPDILNIVPLLF